MNGTDHPLAHDKGPLAPGHEADVAAADPGALVAALESSDRFRRDTGLGGIYHLGKLSFREVCPVDSMHIIIDGDRISAHIDDIAPFRCRPDGTVRYSLARIVAHNLAGMSADLLRLIGGRLGQQRCNLKCERVWVDDDSPHEGLRGCGSSA